MEDEGKKWISVPKYSDKYKKGVEDFVKIAFARYAVGNELMCPCKICSNVYWSDAKGIHEHLICNGPCPHSVEWIYEVSTLKIDSVVDEMDTDIGMGLGNEFEAMIHNAYGDDNDTSEDRVRKGLNDDARKFYRLVKEGGQPLYPECKKFTRLSFIVRLYQLKCIHGFSESAFSDLLELIKEVFPNVNLPSSFNVAKGMIKDLGLDYQKIHACPNDCMLFWAENEGLDICKKCGTSRWKVVEDKNNPNANTNVSKEPKIPSKVMRYFPLKPRLQRMFLSSDFSNSMTWHALARKKDGKLRHPADGQGWKSMDTKYPEFAGEIRNVRLGLAADGFNPYRSMNISHSTWPVVLVNYNLPPWLIMKQENLILSTLIPGPIQLGNEIDVYMQPLIRELKDLWDVGIETYDVRVDNTFKLHASLLWTISDFPGYAVLSGWSTKGKLACPSCHYETSSTYLKHSKKVVYLNHRKFLPPDHKWRSDTRRFNGDVEVLGCPEMLTGTEVEELLCGYENDFGKKQTKHRGSSLDCPWKKKSIFFELPYWSSNMVRHNLDVMHIEKNIFDKILGTLLNIGGKTKDHLNARQDLEEMGIRKILHPVKCADNIHVEIRAANFDMTKKEKEIFCSVLMNAKLPHGSASNISRCVQMKERKVSGYKSHDAHLPPPPPLSKDSQCIPVRVAPPKKYNNQGIGSMESYLVMKDQKKTLEKNQVGDGGQTSNPQTLEETVDTSAGVQKSTKRRGPTRMNKVYTRRPDEKVVIKLNCELQAIADKDGDLAEFKNFCGTLGRQSVPLDLVSWHKFPKQQKEELWSFVKTKYEIPEEGRTYTLRTIGALWKLNKSRIKKDYYLKYDNDEDRLKNMPNVISVEEFKVLLKYWGDKDVQERARKNAENRKLIVETHTAGRKSFAQIGEKIKAEKKIDPKKLAPKDDIYQKTRKRKQGQEYKATTAVEDGSGAEQGKKPKHGPNWLLGRSGKCRKTMKAQQPILCSSSTPATDIDHLKKTIKEEIMAEMQEMVDQKVCEKMSKVIAKLGEINPDFKYLDVEELCADTTTGDESEDSDQEDNDREDDDDRVDDDDREDVDDHEDDDDHENDENDD